MPRKQKFSKDVILNAAFELVKTRGINALTARSLAKALGSSVAPIYAQFSNLDELQKALYDKVVALLDEIGQEKSTADRFFNMGIKHIRFAIRYPKLYEFYIQLEPNDLSAPTISPTIVTMIKENSQYSKLSDEQVRILFLQMKIFTRGICNLVCNNKFSQDVDEDSLIGLMEQTGEALFKEAINQTNER